MNDSSRAPISVVLVDDDAMVRTALSMILGGAPEITVVGQAAGDVDLGEGLLPHGDRALGQGATVDVQPLDGGLDVVDLDGALVVPGFVDAHLHPMVMCVFEQNLVLDTVTTVAEVLDALDVKPMVDVAEIVATITDSTMRPICAALPCGMPKSSCRP